MIAQWKLCKVTSLSVKSFILFQSEFHLYIHKSSNKNVGWTFQYYFVFSIGVMASHASYFQIFLFFIDKVYAHRKFFINQINFIFWNDIFKYVLFDMLMFYTHEILCVTLVCVTSRFISISHLDEYVQMYIKQWLYNHNK